MIGSLRVNESLDKFIILVSFIELLNGKIKVAEECICERRSGHIMHFDAKWLKSGFKPRMLMPF